MGPPFLSIQTEFNKAEEDKISRDLHNSSNHTKDEPNDFFVIHPKICNFKTCGICAILAMF